MDEYELRLKKANDEVKKIRKSNAEFNKIYKNASKNSPYLRSERIERRQRLLDAIKFRDITLPLYIKMEKNMVVRKS